MKKGRRGALALPVLALLGLAVVAVAAAQSGSASGYDLSWWTVDGGGGTVQGGGYTLRGTAGQPDAATWSGASYTVAGGFWGAAWPAGYAIYLPLVLRAYP
jgi:hypothetical protein